MHPGTVAEPPEVLDWLERGGNHPQWPDTAVEMARSQSPDPAVAQRQLAVAEAAMREIMRRNASAAGDGARRFCLVLFGRDPDAAFLGRFVDVQQQVVPGSKFRQHTLHYHADIVIECDSVGLVDATHAEATAGYYEANLSAGGNELWLQREADAWVVVARRRTWIS